MGEYAEAGRKGKTRILTEVQNDTGLSRNHAGKLLGGTRLPVGKGLPSGKKEKRGRKRKYGNEMLPMLKLLWELLGKSCSKRTKEGIENMLLALERHKEIKRLDPDIRKKLLSVSPSTIDRLLKKAKPAGRGKGLSATRPGTLLKRDIPVRRGTDWEDGRKPGFLEIDLVAHCGKTTAGEYVCSLDTTDIFTGWTEVRAIMGKRQEDVFKALLDIKASLPFPLAGIDPDNGSEFINKRLYGYCKRAGIKFTRSRPNQKNDGCHIEEKNWSRVRKNVGFDRHERKEAVVVLNRYYKLLCDYENFLVPSMKLKSKETRRKKTTRRYETPKIPADRLISFLGEDSSLVKRLEKKRMSINPVKTKKEMEYLLRRLSGLAIPYGRT
jgi:hypothetical protein